jgi:microcystin-dependent protein
MAADFNSAILGLLMQGTGNNNNSWGDNLNNFVFAYLEQAIAGFVNKAVTGGPISLTAAEHRAGMLRFSGTLTSNVIVTVDNTSKRWRIGNVTTGNFVLLIKTASGNPTEIPQGTWKDIICDGANSLIRLDHADVGKLVMHCGTTAPPGTLAAAGGTYVRADHPDLYNVIGTTWGPGNGITTAGLPDFVSNNRFMRAAGGSLSVGTYQTSQNKAHSHSVSGTPAVGSLTTDSQGSHTHTATVNDPGHSHNALQPTQSRNDGTSVASLFAFATLQATSSNTTGISVTNASAGAHTHTVTGTLTAGSLGTVSDGGTEARPENGAVLVCIIV